MTASSHPLVSVLIPCYNAERFIADAIDSALGQTYPNIEVVVVDDGSTDRSVEVIKSYDGRITWEAGPNRGGCMARNRAFELSTGEYIQFNDADDLLCLDKVEKQIGFLIRDEADIVLSQGASVSESLEPLPLAEPYPFWPDKDAFSYFLDYSYWVCLPLHKRSLLKSVGGFRPGLRRAQEMDLHLRLAAEQPRLAMVNERLVKVRQHGGPRVTDIKVKQAEMLSLFTAIGEDVRDKLLPHQSALLASKIHDWSSWSYRHGDTAAGVEGFAFARTLARDYPIRERTWVRFMAQTVSPVFAERVLATGRNIKHALTVTS